MPSFERQDGGRRTAAQREAARLERERRRAQRRGEQTALQTLVCDGANSRHDEAQELDGNQAQELDRDEAQEPDRDQAQALELGRGPAQALELGREAATSDPETAMQALDQRPQPSGGEAPSSSGGARRPHVRRRTGGGGHSVRARVGAVGSLAAVVLLAWLAVMLIQHIKDSGKRATAVSPPPVAKVLIPEGETRRQIAAIARKDGLVGDYMRASARSSVISPKRFGAPLRIPNLEGFLFPATYEVPAHGSARQLVTQQLEAFQERFGPETARHAKALGLTAYQLLIVASMIEREALLPGDRPLVAAVIYNRLRLHMPLGIDSTIRFALHDFDKPLTEAQLKTPSPYNTRLHTGLPPTPISNPGLEAIEAAAHPAHVGYLYYVNGADGCGNLVFSDGEAEFEANKLAYDEALRANGGHVPACKRK